MNQKKKATNQARGAAGRVGQEMGVNKYFNFTGKAWLFMGVANSDSKLYDEEFQELLDKYPDRFKLDYALSREQQNKDGGKMYIQDKV